MLFRRRCICFPFPGCANPFGKFVVSVVRRHVVVTDLIVDALARTTDGKRDVVAGMELVHVLSDFDDSSETFMANDEEIVSGWRPAVFGRVDLLGMARWLNL